MGCSFWGVRGGLCPAKTGGHFGGVRMVLYDTRVYGSAMAGSDRDSASSLSEVWAMSQGTLTKPVSPGRRVSRKTVVSLR